MFDRFYITQRGRALLAKAQSGIALNFTRMQIGDGSLPGGQNPVTVTALIHPIKAIPISDISVSDVEAVVSGQVTNRDLDAAFYFREIGLFAADPDYGEILYSYANAGTKADLIPAPHDAEVDFIFSLVCSMDNVENVTFNSQSSLVFVTRDELADLSDPKVIFADQPSAAIADIASGSKLSLLIGKIKKLLADLVGFRDRPSGFATAEQGGKADAALPATGQAADSAKLGGQVPGYYAKAADLDGKLDRNAGAMATNPAPTTIGVRNSYAGTADMTAGTTALATGVVYYVYE